MNTITLIYQVPPSNVKKIKKDINYINTIYESIINNKILTEQYLNHGDISKSNLLLYNDTYYIIDFDEVTITTALYDFAVSIIKIYTDTEKNKIDKKIYNELKQKIQKKQEYRDDSFIMIIKLYLCKILLEKFYLQEIGKISLFSPSQQQDTYKKYLKILKNIEKEELL